jgi:hypothetical protein
MRTPWRSKPSMSLRGTAEPPQIPPRSELRSPPCSSTWVSSAPSTVGTPAIRVARSASTKRASGSPCRKGPGSRSSAPVSAAPKGRPHALTWNIGTTARTRSRDDSPTASATQIAVECSDTERCE